MNERSTPADGRPREPSSGCLAPAVRRRPSRRCQRGRVAVSLKTSAVGDDAKVVKRYVIAIVLALAILGGCAPSGEGYVLDDNGEAISEEEVTFEDPQIDVERLEAAYSEGFEESCSEVWSNSPDGNLYYDGVAYTEDECAGSNDPTVGDDLGGEDEARYEGTSDGFDAAFELSPAGVLCWGEDCYTRSDF